MPVTAASKSQDVVSLNCCDDVIVTLEPIISTCMDPSDVVAAFCGTSLMCDNSDQLIVTSVESQAMVSVKQFVMLFDFLLFGGCLCHGSDQLWLDVFLLFILHFYISAIFLFFLVITESLSSECLSVFFLTKLLFKLPALVE